MTDTADILKLVDELDAVRQMTHLAELAASEACDSDLSRDAMCTVVVEVQNRLAAISAELQAMQE